jgi:hypothetical protein
MYVYPWGHRWTCWAGYSSPPKLETGRNPGISSPKQETKKMAGKSALLFSIPSRDICSQLMSRSPFSQKYKNGQEKTGYGCRSERDFSVPFSPLKTD